jgi:hypothetical protein
MNRWVSLRIEREIAPPAPVAPARCWGGVEAIGAASRSRFPALAE